MACRKMNENFTYARNTESRCKQLAIKTFEQKDKFTLSKWKTLLMNELIKTAIKPSPVVFRDFFYNILYLEALRSVRWHIQVVH